MNQFTKSDLKTGMRVRFGNGEMAIVMTGNFKILQNSITNIIFCFSEGLLESDDVTNELESNENDDDWVITEVYASAIRDFPNKMLNPDVHGELLWERDKEFIESKDILRKVTSILERIEKGLEKL